MEFPITFSQFCDKLINEYEDAMTNYIRADCFRTAFRISLDEYRELMNFFSLNTNDFENRYFLAVKDRTLITITNISKDENECREIIFIDKTFKISSKLIQNLNKIHSDVISADNIQKLVSKNPDIMTEFNNYMEASDGEKKLFWSNKENFEKGKNFLFLKQNKNPSFFYPVAYFFKYFPFEDQSDDTFVFFEQLFKEYIPSDFYDIDKLFKIAYNTRYFKLLFDDNCENERFKRYIFERSGLYKFPFDVRNFRTLEKMANKNFYTEALNYIGQKRNKSIVSDQDYKLMVDIICQNLGIAISPTDIQIIEFCEKKGHIMCGNYDCYWDMFYLGSYYEPSIDEIEQKILLFLSISELQVPDRKYKIPIEIIISSFKKGKEYAIKKLISKQENNQRFVRWINNSCRKEFIFSRSQFNKKTIPELKKYLKTMDLNESLIKGTGKEGKVIKKDIVDYVFERCGIEK